MFRITVDERPAGVILRIEGRFVGHFAEEATRSVLRRNLPAELVVDLSEVTFADAAGEEALRLLRSMGAKFVAESSYSLHLCEHLHLPLLTVLARKRGNQFGD
jgi:anti-anti-sigma regulatory factor